MRLIDADALRKSIETDGDKSDMPKMWYQGIEYAINHIIHAPTIEPERKKGRWNGYNEDKGKDWLRNDRTPVFLVCNQCNGTVINNGSAHWNFCPNCGADMRGEQDEQTRQLNK